MIRHALERLGHAAAFAAAHSASSLFSMIGILSEMPDRPYAMAFIDKFGHALMMSGTVVAIIMAVETSRLRGIARALVQAAALAGGVVAVALAIATITGPDALVVRAGVGSPEGLFLGFLWAGFTGSVLLSWYYDSRERALRSVQATIGVALEREAAVWRADEARLRALHARIDPDFLESSLVRIRGAYRTDAVSGDRLLDALLDHLTEALRSSRGAPSIDPKEMPWPTPP